MKNNPFKSQGVHTRMLDDESNKKRIARMQSLPGREESNLDSYTCDSRAYVKNNAKLKLLICVETDEKITHIRMRARSIIQVEITKEKNVSSELATGM